MLARFGLFVLGAAAVAVAAFLFWPGDTVQDAAAPAPASGEMVSVALPELTGDAALGQRVFKASCAECHGPNAGGIEGSGPPLIHKIYEPSHHGDAAFFLAAEQGVRAHHWRFGDMVPVEGITRAEISAIVAFIRRVQLENGIS
jgi:mono/diheme cytochrome c family protein